MVFSLCSFRSLYIMFSMLGFLFFNSGMMALYEQDFSTAEVMLSLCFIRLLYILVFIITMVGLGGYVFLKIY